MTPPRLQTTQNKQAEVDYRKRRRAGSHANLEPTGEELLRFLRKRVQRTRDAMNDLKNRGVTLSPFLEIGAERGQRAMLLASEFDATGYMLDLSLQALKESPGLKSTLKLSAVPQRVCADATALPFPDESLAFVFAYQTLHHFPDPLPIVKELYRVLAPGGVFFFDEEPIRQSANLRLWRRPTKLRWWEKPLKAIGLLHFISEIGKSETDAGIIEASFGLPTWQRALDVFDECTAKITVFPFGPSQTLIRHLGGGRSDSPEVEQSMPKNWLTPTPLNHFLLNLLGGNIQAICKKTNKHLRGGTPEDRHLGGGRSDSPEVEQSMPKNLNPNVLPPLSCPSCKHHPNLQKKSTGLFCPNCRDTYPVRNGIPILINKPLRDKLYG